MAKRSPKSPTEITSIRHKKDTRVNIPTEELRDFVAEEEQAPKAMRYPRDASLDPQLVWKGKDEQDASALERMSTDFARTIVSAILEAF